MVTPAASERGAGIDPVVTAVPAGRPLPWPGGVNAWTVATLAEDPPPKTSARPPVSPAAASCRGPVSAPIWRLVPVLVLRAQIPSAEAPPAVSPPRMIRCSRVPATATSRLTGAAMCQGGSPASAAGKPRGAGSARGGGSGRAARPDVLAGPAPPPGRATSQTLRTTTSKASAAATARLLRTRAGTWRLRPGHCSRTSALAPEVCILAWGRVSHPSDDGRPSKSSAEEETLCPWLTHWGNVPALSTDRRDDRSGAVSAGALRRSAAGHHPCGVTWPARPWCPGQPGHAEPDSVRAEAGCP